MVRNSRTVFPGLIILLALQGCATSDQRKREADRQSVRLEIVQTLRPGQTTSSNVREILGPPSREVHTDGETVQTTASRFVIWEYLVDEVPKATMTFETPSGALLGFRWAVGANEAEIDLARAKARFRGARFKEVAAEQLCSHYFPDETYFRDETLGVDITYLKGKRHVEAISWYRPGGMRSVARELPKRKKIDCHI